jgi:methionyl-tRNA formyltransferase
LKIVFFGSFDHIIPVIEVLKKNFDLSLVVTTEKTNGAVPTFCNRNKIPFISVLNLKDENLKSKILNLKSQIAVVAYFGLIIPGEILSAYPKGIINIHPSLLPKYRGPSPVQAAILNGEKITGVSIMKIDSEVDHGPILGQEKEDILPTDTAQTLYKRLFSKGAQLLLKTIGLYITRGLKPVAQNHSKATYSKTLTRQDGFIDLTSPSLKIENLKLKIRAYYPWPGVWTKTKLNGKEKIIKLLPDQMIQVEGKKPMSYKDFLNGYLEAKEILDRINSPAVV